MINNTPLSKKDSLITLDYLKNQKENQYFERKGRDTKAGKIAEELIGMANADGGILVFGVADNGEIQDLNQLGDKLDDYRKLVFDFIAPPCQIELEEVLIGEYLVFIFHVGIFFLGFGLRFGNVSFCPAVRHLFKILSVFFRICQCYRSGFLPYVFRFPSVGIFKGYSF